MYTREKLLNAFMALLMANVSCFLLPRWEKCSETFPTLKTYAMLFKDLLNSHTNIAQEVEKLSSFDILYHLVFRGVARGQNCPISFMEPGLSKSTNSGWHTICLIFIRYEPSHQSVK